MCRCLKKDEHFYSNRCSFCYHIQVGICLHHKKINHNIIEWFMESCVVSFFCLAKCYYCSILCFPTSRNICCCKVHCRKYQQDNAQLHANSNINCVLFKSRGSWIAFSVKISGKLSVSFCM